MREGNLKKKLWIKTYGCQMNEYDSEKVSLLLDSSYELVDNPQEADFVFVNTCSVRDKAEQKLYSLLGRLRDIKCRKSSRYVVGVGGCVAQQRGNEIIEQNDVVDFVVGTHNISQIPDLLEQSLNKTPVVINYRKEWENLPYGFSALSHMGKGRSQALSSIRALVSIQRGCDKRCVFCVVPETRGADALSRPLDEILHEIEVKVQQGAKEVLLLGQTVNSWGKDLIPKQSFAWLIRKVAEINGVKRIRFTSPHPTDVKNDFLDLYGDVPELCPHIHLPLQSGSDVVLKRMNRNYRRKRYLDIVESIRDKNSDIAITSDIIVGFPKETAEDFSQTMDLIEKVRFAASYSFVYSERPNTASSELYSKDDQIPREIAMKRLWRLQEFQKVLTREYNARFVHRRQPVLMEVCDEEKSLSRGRTPHNVMVSIPEKIKPGEMVNVKMIGSSEYGLKGVRIAS